MSLASSLLGLKSKLNNFESEFESKLKEVQVTEGKEKRSVKEDVFESIVSKKDPVVTFNVGGKLFKCTYSVLVSIKDSLFEKLYEEGQRINEVLFFDRSYSNFHIILNFIRNKTFNPKDYSRTELEDLKFESEYYAIHPLTQVIDEVLNKVEFVSFTSSGRYSSNGTHKIEDLSNKDLKTGICVQSPYFITVEFNFEHEFDKIEIGGCTCNTSSWAPSNGVGSNILTSTDGVIFNEVGKIPNNFGASIITVPLKKSTAKFIKFQHNSYVGLGYLNILK